MNVAVEAQLTELKAGGFDVLLDSTDIGIAILDHDLKYRTINKVLANFNGLSPELHLDRTVSEVLPKLAPVIVPKLQSVLDTGVGLPDLKIFGETPSTEGREAHWEASYLPINDNDGNTIGVLAIAKNKTLEYKLECARNEGYELVRQILDSLFTFVCILTPEGILIDANAAPLVAAGVDLDDVIGKRFWDCIWWNYSPQAQNNLKDAIKEAANGKTVRFDVVNRTINNTRITVDFMLSPLRNEAGVITHLIASANDVSQREKRETELSYSEERFRRVFQSTADGLLMIDESGKIILANKSVANMFGYAQEDMYQCVVEDLVPDSIRQQHVHDRKNYMVSPQARSMGAMRELHAKRRDGSMFPVEIALTPLQFPEGVRILATVVDISIQKDIQSSLMNALIEKTALLNEVHHRVKNNLQVVSSLLNLQSRAVPDELRPHFQESRARIKAMALIHQQLYEQKAHELIDASLYTGKLLGLIRRGYTNDSRKFDIQYHTQETPVQLTMDQALPFGLLVNELLTNAIKHAFKDIEPGKIDITVLQEKGETKLIIEDNGVGIPADKELGKTRSLGFQLIPGLIQQLKGRLNLVHNVGSRFEIVFKTEVFKK